MTISSTPQPSTDRWVGGGVRTANGDPVIPYRWFVSSHELDDARAGLARLTSRAARKGFNGKIWLDARPATRSYLPAPGAPPDTVHGHEATMSGEPPVYAGWRFVGAIDTLEDHPYASYPPGIDPMIPRAEVRPGVCDHCHTRRPTDTVLLVTNDHTGESRQVGIDCVRAALGWRTVPPLITTDDVGVQPKLWEATAATGEWGLGPVLTYTWAAASVYGWTPSSAARSDIPTRDLVAMMMRGGPNAEEALLGAGPYLLQGARMVSIIIDTLTETLTKPDRYQADLRAIVTAGRVNPERQLGLAVSAVPTYQRMVNPELVDHDRHAAALAAGHAGRVGEKVTVTGRVITAITVDAFDEMSPDRRLVILNRGSDTIRTVSTADWAYQVQRGDLVTITGAVQAHTEHDGRPRTVLARSRLLDSPPPKRRPAPEISGEVWEVLSPARLRARPFPGPANPLAPPTRPQTAP